MYKFQDILTNVANSTPPPKHMAVKDYDPNAPKELSIEKIIEKCEQLRIDPHEVIALALTDEMREIASESGMTMKAQAELIAKLMASKKSVELSGNVGFNVTVPPEDAGTL